MDLPNNTLGDLDCPENITSCNKVIREVIAAIDLSLYILDELDYYDN